LWFLNRFRISRQTNWFKRLYLLLTINHQNSFVFVLVMNKREFIFISFFLIAGIYSFAQEVAIETKRHRGFYLALGGGPIKGTVNGFDNQGYMAAITGTGTEMNGQIGGAFSRKWILHFTLDLKYLNAPTINNSKTAGNFSLNESFVGGGLTHYTRQNFFLTANAGSASFSFSDQRNKVSTENGFAYQFKIGKEWWLARKAAIGLALTYNKAQVTNHASIGTVEKWNSNRFGIIVQTTLN